MLRVLLLSRYKLDVAPAEKLCRSNIVQSHSVTLSGAGLITQAGVLSLFGCHADVMVSFFQTAVDQQLGNVVFIVQRLRSHKVASLGRRLIPCGYLLQFRIGFWSLRCGAAACQFSSSEREVRLRNSLSAVRESQFSRTLFDFRLTGMSQARRCGP